MSKKTSIIKSRIRKYVDFKGISYRKFNKTIDASESFLKSDGGFNVDFLPVIRQNYPDLNINWLLFDKGEMTLSEETDIPILSGGPIEYLKNQKLEELSLLGLDAKIEGVINDIDVFKEELRKLVLKKVNEAMNNKNI